MNFAPSYQNGEHVSARKLKVFNRTLEIMIFVFCGLCRNHLAKFKCILEVRNRTTTVTSIGKPVRMEKEEKFVYDLPPL